MLDTTAAAVARPPTRFRRILQRAWDALAMPLLAIFTAFLVGGVVIWITSGKFEHGVRGLWRPDPRRVFQAARLLGDAGRHCALYLPEPGPWRSASRAGLFNIGVEGQFYIGAICAAWVGQAFSGLPAIIHLPLAVAGRRAGRRDLGGDPRLPQGPDGRARSHQHDHDELHCLPAGRVPGQWSAARHLAPRQCRRRASRLPPSCGRFSAVPERLAGPAQRAGRGARRGVSGLVGHDAGG